jgi:hypothetical protein
MSEAVAEIAIENVAELTLSEELPTVPLPAEPTADFDMATIAYRLWEERGRPEGDADRDWYEAERKVRSRNGSE